MSVVTTVPAVRVMSSEVSSPETLHEVVVWGDYSLITDAAEVVLQVMQDDRLIWVTLNPIQSNALRNALKAAEAPAIKATATERGLYTTTGNVR